MSDIEIRSLNGHKLTDETARSNIEKLRTESQQYTNTKISQLINSAPTTLDTLGEIAAAMAENTTVVEALNAAIGQKAGKDYVDEAIANLPKGEPDWDAKEGEEGYIKNRTHWEESEVIVTFDGVFSEEDLLPEELREDFGNMVRVGEHILLDSQAYLTILPAILISNTNKKFTGNIVFYRVTESSYYLMYIDEITKELILLGLNVKETLEEEQKTLKEGLYLSYEEDFYYTEIRKLKIQQIDKKFLPIESADWYSSESETNCIKNRTHYENVNKYSFNSRNRDNYQSCNIVFNNKDFTCFKISENVPSLEKIEKNGQVSQYINIATDRTELIPASESIISHEEEGYYIVECKLAGFFICNDKQLLPETMSSLNEGIWLALPSGIFSVYGEALEIETNLYITKNIKQLDEKFIPDTIARVDQIADSINIDTTLSIEGAAADAKATGNRISAVEEIVNHMPTAYVGTEEPTDPNINVWINPEDISSNDGTWELAINQEVPESCNEVSFLYNDYGESLTKYKELIILFHLKGNNGNGSDVQAYTTGVKFGFSKDRGAWSSPFNTRMSGYNANEERHQFMIYHMLKTPYGILNLGTYSQYNTGSMSNSYSIVGASGVHQDARLPISANTDPTLEMTTFSSDVEFERFVIGGYQQVIGAGSIIKIWGRVE